MSKGIWFPHGEGDIHIHDGALEGMLSGVVIGVNPTLKNLEFSSPCLVVDYEKQTVSLQKASTSGEPVTIPLDKAAFATKLAAFLASL